MHAMQKGHTERMLETLAILQLAMFWLKAAACPNICETTVGYEARSTLHSLHRGDARKLVQFDRAKAAVMDARIVLMQHS
jgi:hypothetical protein